MANVAKRKERKAETHTQMKEAVEKNYRKLYIVQFKNSTADAAKNTITMLRKDGDAFFSKKGVLRAILRDVTSGVDMIEKKDIKGEFITFFTNLEKKEAEKQVSKCSKRIAPKRGHVLEIDIKLEKGPLHIKEATIQTANMLCDKWGLPVKVEKTDIVLEKDTVMFKKGTVLTSEQVQLLNMFELRPTMFCASIVSEYDIEKLRKDAEDLPTEEKERRKHARVKTQKKPKQFKLVRETVTDEEEENIEENRKEEAKDEDIAEKKS